MKILCLIRVRQWIKNILIFFPAVIAIHEIGPRQAFHVVMAFFSWCLVASAGYVFNDLLDRESDRLHPIRKSRPLASGEVSVQVAVLILLALLCSGLLISYILGRSVLLLLLVYLLLNASYSAVFKRVKYLDVAFLTLFYLLRLFMGSYASGIAMSQWFILTCYFMFFSLSLNKRYLELKLVENGQLERRDYSSEDYDSIKVVSYIASYVSIAFAVLYMVFSLEMISPVHYVVFLSVATMVQLSFFDDRVVVTDDPLDKLKSKPALIAALVFLAAYIVVQKYYV